MLGKPHCKLLSFQGEALPACLSSWRIPTHACQKVDGEIVDLALVLREELTFISVPYQRARLQTPFRKELPERALLK